MKMKYFKFLTCIAFLLGLNIFSSCNGNLFSETENGDKRVEELSIVNWNVQTFFDSVNDGSEYSEFVSSKNWGTELYMQRLERLVSAIKMFDADVLVMEELENEGVLYDISNFLAGEWNQKKVYRYGCFAKDEGSSIGCGILSRFPMEDLTTHAMDIRLGENMPKVRPLMQVSIEKNGRILKLFVNHWKSMSGGESETELWRVWQESVLSRRISLSGVKDSAILICGDFNRDIENFKKGSNGNLILLRNYPDEECDEGVEVVSPWFDETLKLLQPGSYFYDGQWSRIDNFFACGLAKIVDFNPVTDGPWCDQESKVPIKYQLWNGSGYSDHLPISCVVKF